MAPRTLLLAVVTLGTALGLGACPASTSGSTGTSTAGGGTGTGSGGAASTGGTGGGMTCSGPYGTITCPVGEYCTTSEPTCFPLLASSGGSTGRPAGSSSGGRASSSGSTGTTGSNYDLDAGPPYTPGWPKWHNDNADRGLSQADTSKNTGAMLWKFEVGAPTVGSGLAGIVNPNPTYMNSPVVDASGNVYQLGMSGTFYAIGDGGAQLWTATLLPPNPDEHPATPIIAADHTLFIETGADSESTSVTGQLYHLDAATGKILFQAGPPVGVNSRADGFDVCPSIGADGLLFDGDDFFSYVTYQLSSDGSFVQATQASLQLYGERLGLALDSHDDSYWCASNTCLGVSSPAAGFQILSGWNQLGAPIGDAPGTGGPSWTNPDLAIDEGHTGWLMVEAGTQDGGTGSTEVVAMDPASGNLHWDTKLPSGPTPGAFNSITQEGIFSSDVGNSAPAIDSDGTVYVGNVDGLYALDGGTGAIGWTYKPSQDTGANADVDTAAAIGGDGTIFFGTAGGTFYAVQPDGGERFHYATGGRISSSPAIGPDGTVFFVSDDGYLYAIH